MADNPHSTAVECEWGGMGWQVDPNAAVRLAFDETKQVAEDLATRTRRDG